jgi:TonB family protein
VRVTVDRNGDVVNAEIAKAHSNSQINEQAIIAARKMKFASRSEEGNASGRVTINFTVAGSDFDRQARQRREQQERQAREREEQQRQAREREQQRQAELERERKAQQQQQPPLEQPSPDLTPPSDPIPSDAPETGQ